MVSSQWNEQEWSSGSAEPCKHDDSEISTQSVSEIHSIRLRLVMKSTAYTKFFPVKFHRLRELHPDMK